MTTVAVIQLGYGAAVAGRITVSAGNAVSGVSVVLTDLTTNSIVQDHTDDNGQQVGGGHPPS